MPLDPARRHQIEQDVLTAAWEVERLAACDEAIALLREIADLEGQSPGILRKIAESMGMADDFAIWEA